MSEQLRMLLQSVGDHIEGIRMLFEAGDITARDIEILKANFHSLRVTIEGHP